MATSALKSPVPHYSSNNHRSKSILMWERLNRYKLLIVLLIAIVARLAILFAFPSVFAYSNEGAEIHGSVAYDEYALNLLETGIYGRTAGIPDSVLPPLYSYVVAAVYGLFGRSYLAIGILHTLFDVLSIALLYDISRRLFPKQLIENQTWGEWMGALAGLFFALYPYLIFQNLTLIDTPLWILLLHLFVWLMILLRERDLLDRQTLLIAIAGGLVLGVATLGRALLPPLAILVALWFLFRLSFKQTLLRLLPVAIVSVLVLLPWMVRGYQIYGGFVAVALNSGENVYQGNNPQTVPYFRAGYDVQWSSPPDDIPETDDRYIINNALMQAGLRYLRENPDKIPELILVKFQVYWNVQVTPLKNLRTGEKLRLSDTGEVLIITDEGSQTGVTDSNSEYEDNSLFNVIGRNVHILYFGGLWFLAIIGTWLSRREWRTISLLWFVQISQTIMYVIFHPSTRYRAPTDPLLFVFSAYVIVWVMAWWLARISNAEK